MNRLSMMQKLLYASLGIMILISPVLAQVGSEGEHYVRLSNQYTEVKLGIKQPGGFTPPVPGRISVGNVEGDPETPSDNATSLTYLHSEIPQSNYGFTIIRIEDLSYTAILGDTGKGGWDLAPYIKAQTKSIYGEWRTNPGNIVIKINIDLRRDMARMHYRIENQDDQAHSVGMRFHFDEVAFGERNLVPVVPGYGTIGAEVEYQGSKVPYKIEHLENASNPTLISRHLLAGQDITPPDRVVIAEHDLLAGGLWDYTPVTDRAMNNTATSTWWNPTSLAAGGARPVTFYFGSGASTSNYEYPYVLSVQGPEALQYDSLQDSGLSPDPFTVNAYLYNLYTDLRINNASFHISLPSGLELATGESSTKNVAIIDPLNEGKVSWAVRPTGLAAGVLEYSVTANGEGITSKTISRTIVVPCTRTIELKEKWQMISVPFQFSDPTPTAVFRTSATDMQFYQWNPTIAPAGDYSVVDTLQLGEGLWVYSASPQTITLTNATPISTKSTYQIPLRVGWNQFGNPYVYGIMWGRVQVLDEKTGVRLTVEEAALRNWIKPILYWYDTFTGAYDRSSLSTLQLTPWVGYWIKAMVPCKLIIPPVDQLGGGVFSSSSSLSSPLQTRSSSDAVGGWRIQLVAKAGSATSAKAVAGVSSRAADGYSLEDAETPPPLRDYVSVVFPHEDWGANNGAYVEDVRRSDGTTKTWDMEVRTDMVSSDVILTWPDLSSAPKNCVLKLVDVDTNTTRYLRTTSSYRYNSGSSGVRRFKLIAETGQGGRLSISGINVGTNRSSRSQTISYTLSTDAITDVRITRNTGATVRKLTSGRSITRGIESLSWDCRDDAGSPVDRGLYFIEIKATTPEGETAKAVHPMMIAR